ncbi:MAG: hypothetical protein ABWW70_02830 [Thermoproteota archaeon]
MISRREVEAAERAPPVLIEARTRALEVMHDIASLLGQAGNVSELLMSASGSLLGREVGGELTSLSQLELAAYKMAARYFAKIASATTSESMSIANAYSLVAVARDIGLIASLYSQGEEPREEELVAPDDPRVSRFLRVVGEEGLMALPRILRSLGMEVASAVLEAQPDTPLQLALDLELLSAFREAYRGFRETPGGQILCGRMDIYALRAAASSSILSRELQQVAELVAKYIDSCLLPRDRLVALMGEADYRSAIQQIAASTYGSVAETSVELVDAFTHRIRKLQRERAIQYSLSDPLEPWFPAPVMELLLLNAEDVSAIVSGTIAGLTREQIAELVSMQ